MSEYVALCTHCRRTFTQAEISGANSCPGCGSKSVPADPRKTMTATLTTHEWRLLGIWAHNWGEKHSVGGNPIDGIMGEVRRQNPEAPPLTMSEEFAGIKKEFPTAEIVKSDGSRDKGGLN